MRSAVFEEQEPGDVHVQEDQQDQQHIARHMQALPHISRAHVYRIGDGGAHLHIWFFARPEGQAQLYGSWMVVWDDLLPEYPQDIAEADAVVVANALVASYGGRRHHCP